MTFRSMQIALFAGLVTVAMTLPAASLAPSDPAGASTAKAVAGAQYAQGCFTDEGYGRKTPCSIYYKGKKKKKVKK